MKKIIGFLLFLSFSSGCGTMLSLAKGPEPFSGIKTDYRVIDKKFFHDGDDHFFGSSLVVSDFCGVGAMVDYPFSLVGDMVLLPLTLPLSNMKHELGFKCRENGRD